MKKICLFVLMGIFLTLNLSTLQAATIRPNTFEDDAGDNSNNCSLREAIDSVNNGVAVGGCAPVTEGSFADPSTIILQQGTYLLDLPGSCENDNQYGDLDILAPVTINGAGMDMTFISGAGLVESGSAEDRVFHIGPDFNSDGAEASGFNSLGITVNFNGFTVTAGNTKEADYFCNADGGGILVGYYSTLNMTGVRVTNNKAGGNGGGVGNYGVLNAMDSRVDTNKAHYHGGGIGSAFENVKSIVPIDVGGQSVAGAGLLLEFQMTILDSTVDGNEAGVVFIPNGINSGDGGGVALYNSPMFMDQTTVSGNTAHNGSGGGIDNNNGLAVIKNSTISGNTASSELAMMTGPYYYFFSGNGGGISCRPDLVAAEIPVPPGACLLVNSTVSNNTADVMGGGISTAFDFLWDMGEEEVSSTGTMVIRPVPTDLFNVTVAENVVTNGRGGNIFVQDLNYTAGGDGDGDLDPIPNVTIINTIVADGQANVINGQPAGAGAPGLGPDCFPAIVSAGYNLVTDTSECILVPSNENTTGDKTNVPAGIAPLGDYGGPTHTHNLLEGSLAIDMGDPSGCVEPDLEAANMDVGANGASGFILLDRDQRNFTRPVDGLGDGVVRCDIGAVEFSDSSFDVDKDDGLAEGLVIAPGSEFTYTITITNLGPAEATGVMTSDPLPSQLQFLGFGDISQGTCSHDGVSPGGLVTCEHGDLFAGQTITIEIGVRVVEGFETGTIVNEVTVSASNKTQRAIATESTQVSPQGQLVFVFGSGCSLAPQGVGMPMGGTLLLCMALGMLVSLRFKRGVKVKG